MEKISKNKLILKVLTFFIVFVIIFIILSNIFERKTDSKNELDSFYNLKEDSLDIIFFGSSHLYSSIRPRVLQEEFNIQAYLISTDRQPIQASYHWILETIKTQSPEMIVLETYMVNRSEAMLEEIEYDSVIYTASENMQWSSNKINLLDSLTVYKDNKLPYYINFFKYHNRWNELTEKDFSYSSNQADTQERGYIYLEKSTPVVKPDYSIKDIEVIEIYETDLFYLNKIMEVTAQNDIELILLSAPYMIGESSARVQLAISHFARHQNIEFYDANEKFGLYNFDLNTDFYDAGHLNIRGANKFTKIFGQYLYEKLK